MGVGVVGWSRSSKGKGKGKEGGVGEIGKGKGPVTIFLKTPVPPCGLPFYGL